MTRILTRGVLALAATLIAAGSTAAPPSAASSITLDAASRAQIVEALAERLASSYAVPEGGAKMADAVRGKLAAGAYDRILSPEGFARALQADVRAVVDDRHLRVTFDGARTASPAPPRAMPDVRNGAIGRLQILPGNIGYIEVSGVPPGANAAIDAAFAFVRETDALIIDLRGNGGGWPETVAYYMSYLSEGAPYTVMRVLSRRGEPLESRTTDLGARSYGAKKPVYVLTSKYTFSGGEEFAYDVQAFERGKVVGETTGGGANPGGPQALGHGFTVFVPTGLAQHPVTGTSWEGVGVKPDVAVDPALALLEAHRLAAESLARNAADARQGDVLRTIAATLTEQKAASAQPPSPSAKFLAQLAGRYAPVGGSGPSYTVAEKDGHLVLQSSGSRPPYRLEPVRGGAFHMVGLPDDFTASFTGSTGARRLLIQQSNSWPPLLLEQQ